MGRYAICFNDQEYQFDIHRAGCADIGRLSRMFRKYNSVAQSDAETPEDAEKQARVEEFGTATVCSGPRKGQEVDDATFEEIGASFRIMPCCR